MNFLNPVNENTPLWGGVFASFASTCVHIQAIAEEHKNTNIGDMPFPKALIGDMFLLTGTWTTCRYIVEKGFIALGKQFIGNDSESVTKIKGFAVPAASFISSIFSAGCLYFAQELPLLGLSNGQKMELIHLVTVTTNVTIGLFLLNFPFYFLENEELHRD